MTPGGKLQVGDRVKHVSTNRIYEVVKREGNDEVYSVIVKPTDGRRLPVGTMEAFGYPGCFRVLEMAWWLREDIWKYIERG